MGCFGRERKKHVDFQSWKDKAQKSALERPELPYLLPPIASQPQTSGLVWDCPVIDLPWPLYCREEPFLWVFKGQP